MKTSKSSIKRGFGHCGAAMAGGKTVKVKAKPLAMMTGTQKPK